MLAYLGLDYTLDPKRVSVWNRLFRRSGKFSHPNNYVANGIKQPKPKIFALFPQAVAMVNEFVLRRLDHITSEMVQYELISKINNSGTGRRSSKGKSCRGIQLHLWLS